MSSTIDLDFQDYAPTADTSSGHQQQQQQQQTQQPSVQILIPQQSQTAAASGSGGSRSLLQNVFQNIGQSSSSSSSGGGGGLSDEALQQLIWLTNKQRSKQQQSAKNSAGASWGLGLLAQYFDVTTSDVIQRIVWSAIPLRKEGLDLDGFQVDSDLTEPLTSELLLNNSSSEANDSTRLSERFGRKRLSYMERFIQSRPDFYGPFWVSTTLIFAIGIFSNIVSSIKHQSQVEEINHLRDSLIGHSDLSSNVTKGGASIAALSALGEVKEWHYSMNELNSAASLITFYVTLWPSFLWFLFWLRGCAKYYTLTETICAYGYSLSVFIPMTALLVVQASAFRYLIISLAAALSGSVLVLSFLPMVQVAGQSSGSGGGGGSHFAVLVMVFVCQFMLAYILHRIMLQ